MTKTVRQIGFPPPAACSRRSAGEVARRAGRGGAGARAFTLIEALVAIGAMALVAVGIAAIFQSVGKTITGGKRLNVLNSYAAMIEQTMRRDFESMTRDGFLLVRHSYADALPNRQYDAPNPADASIPADTVPLSENDTTPGRSRRVDEILFFAKGDFTSAREPLDPRYVARAKEARLYYGHAMRMRGTQQSGSKSDYKEPGLQTGVDWQTLVGSGTPNRLGTTGPNRYARDWTLLRHVTLLVKPESGRTLLPAGNVFNHNPATAAGMAVLEDKEGQIALQPAAWSIFRSLARALPLQNDLKYIRETQETPAGLGDRDAIPMFDSGLVDIATEDLTEIRTIVLSMPPYTPPLNVNTGQANQLRTEYSTNLDSRFEANVPVGTAPVAMHAWMDDAWPAQSDPTVQTPLGGRRIRAEGNAPDYVGALTAPVDPDELAIRRADQLALTASNFVVGCTEFIVEYSFGEIDPNTNALLWHGLPRRVATGDGTANLFTIVNPYPYRGGTNPQAQNDFSFKYRDFDGKEQAATLPRELVYTNASTVLDPSLLSLTAHFGYLDPHQGNNLARPWAWPTMIRVTMSLTDPNNPVNEETFQFVFPTAGNPR